MAKELLEAALKKFCGGEVVVREYPDEYGFSVTIPGSNGIGGYCGGSTSGIIKKGKLFPRMTSGIDPLGMEEWYKIMYPS